MSILVLTSDTLIGTPATGNIEYNGQFFGTDSNASRAQMQRITSGTAVASTSGTSVDFTALPSWVKRITVQFSGVSTNGSSVIQVQLGTGSTSYTTSGYLGSSLASTSGSAPLISLVTTGIAIGPDGSATFVKHGTLVLTNITGNTWVGNGNGGNSDVARVWTCGSSIALAATLTAVRITTVSGTDLFDLGSVNILYEG